MSIELNHDPQTVRTAVVLTVLSEHSNVDDYISRYGEPVYKSIGMVVNLPAGRREPPQRSVSQSRFHVNFRTSNGDPGTDLRDGVGLAVAKFPQAEHIVLLTSTHVPLTHDFLMKLVEESGDRGVVSCTTVRDVNGATRVVNQGLEGVDGTLGGRNLRYIARRHFDMLATDIRIRQQRPQVDFVTPHCLAMPRAAADLLLSTVQSRVGRPSDVKDIDNVTREMSNLVSSLQFTCRLFIGTETQESTDYVAIAINLYVKRIAVRVKTVRKQFGLETLSISPAAPPGFGGPGRSNESVQSLHETLQPSFDRLLRTEVDLDQLCPDVMSLVGDLELIKFSYAAARAGYTVKAVPQFARLNLWDMPPWAHELASLGFPLLGPSVLAEGPGFPSHVDHSVISGSFRGDDDSVTPLTVLWDTVCCGCCGFSTEIMHFVLPLHRLRRVRLTVGDDCFCSGYDEFARDVIRRLTFGGAAITKISPPSDILIWVSHTSPWSYFHPALLMRRPDYFIGRSMYEFTKIPKDWAAMIHPINEVWVPGQWVRDTFIANGVPAQKILVVPEGIDVTFFNPNNRGKITLPLDGRFADWTRFCNGVGNASNYKFFSNFKWEPRKGWDILFEAYFREFTRDSPVSLYVLTNVVGTALANVSQIPEQFSRWVNSTTLFEKRIDFLPHFCIITDSLDESDTADLYNSIDAFVLPTRGEGWGLPTIQAMALAKPTISTAWGGQMEFMTQDTTFLIDLDGVEEVPHDSVYGFELAKKWATPSTDHTAQLMRYVLENAGHAATVGERARAHVVEHFSEEVVARVANRRFNEIRDWIKHLRRQGEHQ